MSARDPIRMYLSQMGNIPLLSRDDEIFLAKEIEITRKRFRRNILRSFMALENTVGILERVQSGELPFDRTIKVSLTERLTKAQVSARMPVNLPTLRRLMQAQRRDFAVQVDNRACGTEKAAARQRFLRRGVLARGAARRRSVRPAPPRFPSGASRAGRTRGCSRRPAPR